MIHFITYHGWHIDIPEDIISTVCLRNCFDGKIEIEVVLMKVGTDTCSESFYGSPDYTNNQVLELATTMWKAIGVI